MGLACRLPTPAITDVSRVLRSTCDAPQRRDGDGPLRSTRPAAQPNHRDIRSTSPASVGLHSSYPRAMAALCSVAALGGARLAPSRSSTSSSEQRAARAGRVLVRAAAADGRDATGLSSLRFGKPSQGDMDALMQEWRR